MRKITLFLGMMLTLSSLAAADSQRKGTGINVFPDVSFLPAQKKPDNAPQRIVNDEKLNGKLMYATTIVDYDQPSFVKFYRDNVYQLDRVGVVKEYDGGNIYKRYSFIGGQWHDGSYLGYLTLNMDFGFVEMKGFASVDLSTGTYRMLKEIPSTSPEDDPSNQFYFMDAMTTDPTTGRLIGLSHYFYGNEATGDVVSYIGEVDPENGDYYPEKLGEYYFCIEYDHDGTLWAARWDYNAGGDGTRTGSVLVTLDPDTYKETSKVKLTREGQPFYMYFNNSMRFDPSTNDLYMLACEYEDDAWDQDQYMVKIDPQTGVMTTYGETSYSQVLAGLYIPGFKGSVRGCASFVTGLTSSFDDSGKVTLSWTNPTTTWDDKELDTLAEVLVCRDNLGDVVATLKDGVTVGGSMSWTDYDATQGLHTYYVVPCRVAGERGIPDSWNAFAGRDVPGKPENVTITKESSNLKLSWKAPEMGAHDGWYDKSTLKYNITRYPDEKQVATNHAGTEFTDNQLGEMQDYYYDIEPLTVDGKGLVATTDHMLAGSGMTPPYSTDMSTEEKRGLWTIVDANGDGTQFYQSNWDPYIGLAINTTYYANNDYAISPAIKLKGGETYKTTWKVFINQRASEWYPDQHNDFRFTAGKGVTAESQTTEMLKVENYQTELYDTFNMFEAFFTPETDGEYNFGFNVVTEGSDDSLCLNAFSVEKVYDKDLAAESLEGTTMPAKGAASDYVVTVKNKGSKTISESYKVQIVRLDGDSKVVLGETETSESIEPQGTKNITVSAVPDVEGDFQLAAFVVLAGDEEPGNNTSAPMTVTAGPEGQIPLNFEVSGERPSLDTRMPISFTRFYSHTQSIYRASELKDVKSIHRLALIYDTNTPVDEFDVHIYMGLTDKDGFDESVGNEEWIPLSELTNVYNGKKSIKSGSDNVMVFDLDNPFAYDDSMNLVVTFLKSGYAEDDYPASFHMYNEDWYAAPFRSLRFEHNSEEVAAPGDGYSLPSLPVLQLAVDFVGQGGIGNIVLCGDGISFDGNIISLDGADMASIAVYDLAGRVVTSKKLAAGESSVRTRLNPGIYIVKAVGRDGKTYTKTIRAGK